MAGVDIRTVQELMGHSTITMTMRYAHLFPRSLAHGGQSSEFGGHCSESERGTWSKTGSNENQRLERGPVRMTHPLKYLQGNGGGAGRVRTAAYQFAPPGLGLPWSCHAEAWAC